MDLQQLIDTLSAHPDQDAVFKIGFKNPDSWRGSYDEIAFAPAKDVPLALMLKQAEACLGSTFTGYKGGEFTMEKHTPIHIDNYGEWTNNDQIWDMLLKLMLNQK